MFGHQKLDGVDEICTEIGLFFFLGVLTVVPEDGGAGDAEIEGLFDEGEAPDGLDDPEDGPEVGPEAF